MEKKNNNPPPFPEGKVELAFKTASFGMAVLNIPYFQVVCANDTLCAMLGRKEEGLIGKALIPMMIGEDLPVCLDSLQGEEFPVTLPGSTARWVRVSISSCESGDGLAMAIVEDVSEAHEMEAQLIHADRLAQLGGLAASLLHDVSQPLNIMRLTGENALDRLDGCGETGAEGWRGGLERQKRSLSVVLDQVRRVQEVFDRVVSYCRPESGPPDVFALEPLLAEVLADVRGLPCARSIRFDWQRPAGAVLLFGQRSRLKIILEQLLINACEAIISDMVRSGGAASHRIGIGTHVDEDGGEAVITIEDDGPGMPPDVLERLFRPARSGMPLGKGLGLPVSLGLAAELGGRIENVKTGQGARVEVRMPCMASAAKNRPQEKNETKE